MHPLNSIKPAPKRVRIKTERRREQCRINQKRYRQRQLRYVSNLESSIGILQAEIEKLDLQLASLHAAVSIQDKASNVILEFNRLFRYGLLSIDSHYMLPSRQQIFDTQINFIVHKTDQQVKVFSDTGRHHLLAQLHRFAICFQDMVFVVEKIERIGTDGPHPLVCISYQLIATLCSATIVHLFPHVLKSAWILSQLLGQRIAIPLHLEVEFNERCLMSRICWELDLVTALQTLLSLEDVAVVISTARIEHSGFLVGNWPQEPQVDQTMIPPRRQEIKEEIHATAMV
jgi:uncharacterized small protein (DUF1192 family)